MVNTYVLEYSGYPFSVKYGHLQTLNGYGLALNMFQDQAAEFDNRVKKIDLIDEFYVQQLNKDYVLVKIRYLGKISKIMNKLKDVDIELKMIAGQWQLNILKWVN